MECLEEIVAYLKKIVKQGGNGSQVSSLNNQVSLKPFKDEIDAIKQQVNSRVAKGDQISEERLGEIEESFKLLWEIVDKISHALESKVEQQPKEIQRLMRKIEALEAFINIKDQEQSEAVQQLEKSNQQLTGSVGELESHIRAKDQEQFEVMKKLNERISRH